MQNWNLVKRAWIVDPCISVHMYQFVFQCDQPFCSSSVYIIATQKNKWHWKNCLVCKLLCHSQCSWWWKVWIKVFTRIIPGHHMCLRVIDDWILGFSSFISNVIYSQCFWKNILLKGNENRTGYFIFLSVFTWYKTMPCSYVCCTFRVSMRNNPAENGYYDCFPVQGVQGLALCL